MIHPAPALAVRADTSIQDCLHQMREKRVGSILVVSDDFEYKLLGIFTERDLLMKVEQIQKGAHWDKPIHTIMTHPVLTVTLDELDQAPRLMMERGIRHLPVVEEARLVGVVSMRDFFGEWARQGLPENSLKKQVNRGEVSVFSHDPALLKLLWLRASKLQTLTSVAEFEELLATHSKMPLVLDLDLTNAVEFGRIIQTALTSEPRPRLLVVFDPARQSERALKLIQSLEQIPGISVFSRPVNLLAFSDALTSSGSSRKKPAP